LRAQELIIIKTTSAQASVVELVVSLKVAIAESVQTPVPHIVPDQRAAGIPRTPSVPTAVARVMTIHKPIELFLLASATSLAEAHGWQRGQQKKACDYQQYLAITFH